MVRWLMLFLFSFVVYGTVFSEIISDNSACDNGNSMILVTDFHYTGQIWPVPQKMISDWKRYPLNGTNFAVELAKNPCKAATFFKGLFQQRINTLGSKAEQKNTKLVTLYLGLLNSSLIKDKLVKFGVRVDEPLKNKADAYIIRTFEMENQTIIIAAGTDNRGIYYAAASLLQQIGTEQGNLVLKIADIDDWPYWKNRYYSNNTPPTRKIMQSFSMYKIGGLAFEHRREWRQFGAKDYITGSNKCTYEEALTDIAEFNKETGDVINPMLTLNMYAVRGARQYPWLDISKESDIQEVIKRLRFAAGSGIKCIMICFDDWTPKEDGEYVCPYKSEKKKFNNSAGKAHGYLMQRIYNALETDYPSLELMVCSAVYSLGQHKAEEPKGKEYLNDLASMLPEKVSIVWSGNSVVSPDITKEHFLKYTKLVKGHKLVLWDNSTVQHHPLFLKSVKYYSGFEDDAYHGMIYCNTFYNQFWYKVYCVRSNSYFWNPEGFNEEKSHEVAVKKIMGADKAYAPIKEFNHYFLLLKDTTDKEIAKPYLEKIEVILDEIKKNGYDCRRLKRAIDKYKVVVMADLPAMDVPSFFTDVPIIDGKLDDRCWSKASEFTMLTKHAEKVLPKRQVTGKIAYNKQALYLAFIVKYDTPLSEPILQGLPDEKVFAHDDEIEIFLSKNADNSEYCHICFDFKGNFFDQINALSPDEWNIEKKIVVVREKDRWIAEVEIPLKEIRQVVGNPPTEGVQWRANFCRGYIAGKGAYCWSPTFANRFHDRGMFGVLNFKE